MSECWSGQTSDPNAGTVLNRDRLNRLTLLCSAYAADPATSWQPVPGRGYSGMVDITRQVNEALPPRSAPPVPAMIERPGGPRISAKADLQHTREGFAVVLWGAADAMPILTFELAPRSTLQLSVGTLGTVLGIVTGAGGFNPPEAFKKPFLLTYPVNVVPGGTLTFEVFGDARDLRSASLRINIPFQPRR